MASTCSATFSARPSAKYGASATMTFVTPAICAAAAAAAEAFEPATSTCTSPPHWAAAVTVWWVLPFKVALSCSAITNATMICPVIVLGRRQSRLDDFGFGTQLGDQRGDVRHLDAGRALGWLDDFQGFQAWRDIDAQVFRLDGLERLFLGLHDVRQGHIAWLVQTQIGGDDRWQGQCQGFQAAVDFARDGDFAVFQHDFRGERGLRPTQQGCQHLAGLVAVVIDGLLA